MTSYDIAKTLPVGYLTLNEELVIQGINPAAMELLSCTEQDLIGKNLTHFVHPLDRVNFRFVIGALLNQKTKQAVEFRLTDNSLVHKNPLIHVECLVCIADEAALQIRMILLDVTKYKQAQVDIMKSHQKQEATGHTLLGNRGENNATAIPFDSIVSKNVGVIGISESSHIVSINAAASAIFGYPPEALVGSSFAELIQAPEWYGTSGIMARQEPNWEVIGVHKNGARIPVDMCIIEHAIDNMRHFTCIVRDASLRQQWRQQNREHLNKLAEASRRSLVNEILTGLAHEISQPLCAALTHADASLTLIEQENTDTTRLTKTLHKIQQQTLRAGQLIHRIKDFDPYCSQCRTTVCINALIEEAASLCLPELQQYNIQLTTRLASNLPCICADQLQIEQVLINLIRNSVEALRSSRKIDRRHLTIHSQLLDNNTVQVRVKDNGSGINTEQQHKILTPFYSTKAKGIGMGLSICRSLIENHEGTFHFNGEPEKGFTFYFAIPAGTTN